ncbi:alpha/beta hydrolase [Vibrio sp. ABG19]|nr:alpha/beta hydrolase [Vibrio sp. ABG19]
MSQNTVLIRGLFRGKYHWGDLPQRLQGLFPQRRFICLDIPGSGTRCKEISPCHIDAMVESLRNQLPKDQPVDLIAMSMGGMIGLQWAHNYPQQVQSLLCINTTASGFSRFYQRLRPQHYLTILSALRADPERRAELIYSMVSNRRPDQQTITDWAELERRYPMQSGNFFRQLVAAMRFRAIKPSCPVCFISSLRDQLVSHHATQALALAWDCSLVINEQDGHDIPLDNPDWLCQQLTEWL